MISRFSVYCAVLALVLSGCPEPDIVQPDAGGTDAGGTDAGGTDAGGTDGGLDAGTDAGPDEPNVMFVTTATRDPQSLGGRAAADALCNTLAANGALPGQGTYVAWLSVSTESAAVRLAGSRGWVRPDGEPFVDRVEDLLRGAIFYPPRITEQRVANGFTVVHTGTLRDGTPGRTCGDWTSNSGSATHGDLRDGTGLWTDDQDFGCANPSHLYCFGTGRVATVTAEAPVGDLAFVTRGGVIGSAGVGAMDALCESEAFAAGLSGTFVALVATEGAAAVDRLGAGPWSRPDGVRVGTRAQVLARDLEAPVTATADGVDYVLEQVWWGARAIETAGTSPDTCGGWTSSAGFGLAGPVGSSELVQVGGSSSFCTSNLRVMCFQQ